MAVGKLTSAAVSVIAMACLASGAMAGADPLSGLFAALGAADRAMLEASVAAPDIELVTSDGSANDALYAALVKKGWMAEKPAPEGAPADKKLKVYGLTPDGVRGVPGYLAGAGQR